MNDSAYCPECGKYLSKSTSYAKPFRYCKCGFTIDEDKLQDKRFFDKNYLCLIKKGTEKPCKE